MPLRPEILNSWPPGGWQFYQPETGWSNPGPMISTFQQTVNNIINMRRANPRFKLPSDYLSCARALEQYTEARIGHHHKYCIGVDDEAQKKTTPPTFPLQPNPSRLAAVAGVDPRALLEWLGDGGTPVERDLAEKRAAICADCPENSSGPKCPESRRNSWLEWVTGPVSIALKKYLSIKNKLKIETSRDKDIGRCLACKCELLLKVHTPLNHIKDNMEPEVLSKLRSVPKCWVLTEQ